ncbi:MAG: oxidoreductase [Actinomycetota bacterium]
MAIFDKFKRADLRELQEFAQTHDGVEAYLEPQTGTLPQSLLMVARDGEWMRSSVADRGQAAILCKKLGLPFYDAAIVGYPERMRGYKGKPAPQAPSAEELEKWFEVE